MKRRDLWRLSLLNLFASPVRSLLTVLGFAIGAAAILAVLAELEFQAHKEGFPYLRKSIYLKTVHVELNLSAIYLEVIRAGGNVSGSRQIDRAICNCILNAWVGRNRKKWDLFFTGNEDGDDRPSNYAFIARMACFMELWCSWCKEVSCAGK